MNPLGVKAIAKLIRLDYLNSSFWINNYYGVIKYVCVLMCNWTTVLLFIPMCIQRMLKDFLKEKLFLLCSSLYLGEVFFHLGHINFPCKIQKYDGAIFWRNKDYIPPPPAFFRCRIQSSTMDEILFSTFFFFFNLWESH